MKFLNTNESEINPEILSNLLQSVLPNNPLTVGLVCLAGGIGYYSWNFYKNKKQELNIKVIQKNENVKEINDEKKTTLNSNNLTNQSSNRHWLDKFTFLSSNLYKLIWRHFQSNNYSIIVSISNKFF